MLAKIFTFAGAILTGVGAVLNMVYQGKRIENLVDKKVEAKFEAENEGESN